MSHVAVFTFALAWAWLAGCFATPRGTCGECTYMVDYGLREVCIAVDWRLPPAQAGAKCAGGLVARVLSCWAWLLCSTVFILSLSREWYM